MFIFIILIIVVFLIEHLHHSLVINIWDELRLELFLDAFNKHLILKEITFGQVICFL